MRYITDAEVAGAVSIREAIDALRIGFAAWREPGNANGSRQRISVPGHSLNTMSAINGSGGVFGVKCYFPHGTNLGGHVLLYGRDNSLVCAIEADVLGRLRTGAVSAVATEILAQPDAQHLAVIGSGIQAYNQVAAIAEVRPLKTVSVFSPTPERRRAFCERLEADLGISARNTASAQECVRNAQIVVTATRSSEPVIRRDWLAPGIHVNAVGANALSRRELDDETVLSAALLVVDDLPQAKLEAAEYATLAEHGRLNWGDVLDLGTLVSDSGRYGPRSLTVFKSLGIAFADIVLAKLVHEKFQKLP
jgi:alanine dehydrogenase